MDLFLCIKRYQTKQQMTGNLKIPLWRGPWSYMFSLWLLSSVVVAKFLLFKKEEEEERGKYKQACFSMFSQTLKLSAEFSSPVHNDHHRPGSSSQTPSPCTRHWGVHSGEDHFKVLTHCFCLSQLCWSWYTQFNLYTGRKCLCSAMSIRTSFPALFINSGSNTRARNSGG